MALLGPTNTGKTHRALARMLEHTSGMIGLPLRLLAREVYDRLSRELGEHAVALVTGEEKRVGRQARYWVCTVEAMPLQREVDFVAIDEVQLAAHHERGHIFTDRVLHARGRLETWFLGADTVRPLLRGLVPTASVESLPRLSQLKGRGQYSLKDLPARSAVVAFSVAEVYRLADALRQRRGGAAVVLGALSPRARNAQVALYEAREVDYLVATDAIGMGLNLAIRHVAFAGLHKFDGKEPRPLDAAELGQIAGRAGRHLENGSFGTLAPIPPLPEGLERSIEDHRFARVRKLSWRNSDLDTDSIAALLQSLSQKPKAAWFTLVSDAPDRVALERLAEDDQVKRNARNRSGVELLWDVCQIPDYRRSLPEYHAELIKQVFLQLSGPQASVDEDWLARSFKPLDDTRGDLDALTRRIAAVRTLSYISNHERWLPRSEYWMGHTRALEDRLSDALHEQLVQRFVERGRHSVDVAAKRDQAGPGRSDPQGPFGALDELRARLFAGQAEPESSEHWLEDLIAAPHERFQLDERAQILDGTRALAQLTRGASVLRPELKLTLSDLSPGQQLRLSRRLLAWSRDLVQELVGTLREPPDALWSPAARGLAYQLEQSLGSAAANSVAPQRELLSPHDMATFDRLGVRRGREAVYLVKSFEPRQRLSRFALSQAFSPVHVDGLWQLVQKPSFMVPRGLGELELAAMGFMLIGRRAVRCDVAVRVSAELRRRSRRGPFRMPSPSGLELDCALADLEDLAVALGYRTLGNGRLRGPRRKQRARPEGAT